MILCSWSAMAARTSLMQRANNSSVAATCGQAAATSSSFEINLLPFSKRSRRTSKHLGRSSTSWPAASRHPRVRSKVQPSKR